MSEVFDTTDNGFGERRHGFPLGGVYGDNDPIDPVCRGGGGIKERERARLVRQRSLDIEREKTESMEEKYERVTRVLCFT